MEGIQLKEDPEGFETLLGCKVEADLKWHTQIGELIKKLKKRLTGITQLKYAIPFKLRKSIAEGLFNSVLIYCLPVFGGCEQYELESLQVMQNKAARIVTHSNFRKPRKDMYQDLGWLTINQLIYYHTVISVFKIRLTQEPEYLSTILNRTSRTGNIVLPNNILVLAEKSFCFRGSKQWNDLPQNIQKVKKVGQFKKMVKIWILDNVAQFTN